MGAVTASPALVRARLILSAKVIITDHWPVPPSNRCPICNAWPCQAVGDAYAYLDVVNEPRYIPPQRSPG